LRWLRRRGRLWKVLGRLRRLWKVLRRLRRLWKVLGRLRRLWKVLGRFWTSVTAAVVGGAIPSARAAAQCCQF